MTWWLDLQESFYLLFAPCILGVILPFFLAGGILIAIYTAVKRMTNTDGRSK